MNIEIAKLESKLAEMREELKIIRPLLATNRTLMGRSVTLCNHIATCEQMLANARVLDCSLPVNNRPTKRPQALRRMANAC
jgi:hypothetical protein